MKAFWNVVTKPCIVTPSLIGVFALGCEANETLEPVVLVDGFAAPESAYFERGSQAWFVSNVAGNEPGDGSVQRLDSGGNVLDREFLPGLDDPKGIRSHRGVLYVADNTEVIAVRLSDPDDVTRIPVPGAIFLNDVAVDATTGEVYVSDTIQNAIYRIRDGRPELVFQSPELEAPNGLLVEHGWLLIATIGPDLDPSTFTTSAPGSIVRLNLRTLELVPVTDRLGFLDGLERDGVDLLVSDFYKGVYRVELDGTATLIFDNVLNGFASSADIGFDPLRRRLAIPDLLGTEVGFYDFVRSEPALASSVPEP
jgi:hypothetical protein